MDKFLVSPDETIIFEDSEVGLWHIRKSRWVYEVESYDELSLGILNETDCASEVNLNGPNPLTENSPEQIQHCIESGVDVEIDIRYDPKTERLWLGHDEPQHA